MDGTINLTLNVVSFTGRLPGPGAPRAIGRWAYDRLRDPANIQSLLAKTYARGDSETIGDLGERIREVTDASNGGHAAFAR